MGISASTNVGGTTVQAELTYRPNFPLATAITDQANQLGDSVGTTALLSLATAQNIYGSDPTFAVTMQAYNANVDANGVREDMIAAIKSFNRSYLPRISLTTSYKEQLQLKHVDKSFNNLKNTSYKDKVFNSYVPVYKRIQTTPYKNKIETFIFNH